MNCCVCKRVMRKCHFRGIKICYPAFINNSKNIGTIEFPQPMCKRCSKSFTEMFELFKKAMKEIGVPGVDGAFGK